MTGCDAAEDETTVRHYMPCRYTNERWRWIARIAVCCVLLGVVAHRGHAATAEVARTIEPISIGRCKDRVINDVRVSPDGRLLAASTGDTIYIWRIGAKSKPIVLTTSTFHGGFEFSEDSLTLHSWHFSIGSGAIPEVRSPLRFLTYSVANGTAVAATSLSYPPKNVSESTTVRCLFSAQRKELLVAFAHGGPFDDVLDYTVVRVDMKNGRTIGRQQFRRASLSNFQARQQLHAVRNRKSVWDLTTGRKIAEFPVNFHDGWSGFVSLSPDGKYYVVGAREFNIRPVVGKYRIWNVETEDLIGDFDIDPQAERFHGNLPRQVVMTTHGVRLLIAHTNGLRGWNVTTGKEDPLFRFDHGDISCFCLAPNGGAICTAGNHEVWLWNLPMPAVSSDVESKLE